MKVKRNIYIVLIVLGFIGLGRTLDNSVRLIEHIFKPIKFSNGTFYYGPLLILVVTFIGIKGLLKLRGTQKGLVFRTIILTIVMTVVSINIWNHGIKIYSSTKDGLESIYNYHEDTNISLDVSTGILNSDITLENCGDKTLSFNIQVISVGNMKDYLSKEKPIVLPKKYTIRPKEKIKIEEDISVEVDLNNEIRDGYVYSEEVAWELYDGDNNSRVIKHIY